MAQCTAKSKQTGERCKRHAATGRTVCAIHGGKTPRGTALPQTTHGRYSKDMPTRLADRYEASRTDPELLDLSHEIGLTESFIADALRGFGTGESGALWKELADGWDCYLAAAAAGEEEIAGAALREVGEIIKRGSQPYQIRGEVMDLAERRRKLVESETKRRVQMQDMVTTGQVMVFLAQLQQVVMRHVDDPDARAAIAEELGRLTA